MDIHEVENMTVAELKAQKGEVLTAVAGHAELASRYFQARLDAKIRDEKLAEQAVTLDALQTGLAAAKARAEVDAEALAMAAEAANKRADEAKRAKNEHAKAMAALQSEHDVIDTAAKGSLAIVKKDMAALSEQEQADAVDFERRIGILKDRCERLKAQAEIHATGMTAIQKIANDAVATRAIADANGG